MLKEIALEDVLKLSLKAGTRFITGSNGSGKSKLGQYLAESIAQNQNKQVLYLTDDPSSYLTRLLYNSSYPLEGTHRTTLETASDLEEIKKLIASNHYSHIFVDNFNSIKLNAEDLFDALTNLLESTPEQDLSINIICVANRNGDTLQGDLPDCANKAEIIYTEAEHYYTLK
ncbi:ATP-binding protein [Bacillota bacterium LX-D]|nr:ATP-binding protein [Bacillota bacterium LX-D]